MLKVSDFIDGLGKSFIVLVILAFAAVLGYATGDIIGINPQITSVGFVIATLICALAIHRRYLYDRGCKGISRLVPETQQVGDCNQRTILWIGGKMKEWLRKFVKGTYLAYQFLIVVGVMFIVVRLGIWLLIIGAVIGGKIDPITNTTIIMFCGFFVVIFGLFWSIWS